MTWVPCLVVEGDDPGPPSFAAAVDAAASAAAGLPEQHAAGLAAVGRHVDESLPSLAALVALAAEGSPLMVAAG